MPYEYHSPVMVDEVLHFMDAGKSGIYVDGTLGGGGHAARILRAASPGCRLLGFDSDAEAIAAAKDRLQEFGDRVTFVHDNVSNIGRWLHSLSIGKIQGALLDLGISSHQVDEPGRGFSFQQNGPLDMRMDQRQSLDAARILNTYDEQRLAGIFWQYGEERMSRRIAKSGALHVTTDRRI